MPGEVVCYLGIPCALDGAGVCFLEGFGKERQRLLLAALLRMLDSPGGVSGSCV